MANQAERGGRRSAKRGSALCLTTCVVVAVTATLARSHGTMVVPESRIHRCAFDGNIESHPDPACRAAIERGGKQALYDWNGVRRGDAAGQHTAIVPDGSLCSGGNPDFAGIDLARSDWRTTPIAPGANGRFELVWHATAAHATLDWHIYLTKDGWSPSQPLRWRDLDPICTSGEVPLTTDGQGRPVYRIPCSLPARSGRHVLFATWQRSDSPEAFYSCSDVQFTGGPNPTGWQQLGTLQARTALPVGTVVTFRLFDENGGDLERIDVRLARGETSRRLWPHALAKRVNATSPIARIGVLSSSGSVVATKRLNGNLVYGAAGRSLSFEVDVSRPGGGATGGEPVYPSGIGGYGPGSVVRGSDGSLYECRPFPSSGWCNQAPAYYAPGSGSHWSDAWMRR
jgi:chitin-binding protein